MGDYKNVDYSLLGEDHVQRYRETDGEVGYDWNGAPTLLLTTTGRKTGQRRTNMLTTPVVDGERIVLVGSWGGDDRHPMWFLNLQANPDVEITRAGGTRAYRARVATPEERAELWPRVTAKYNGYAGYQKNTEREIPLVICEPV